MATKIETRLIDDIDGGVAHETVRFSLEGKDYAIDLSSSNAKKLRTTFAPYQNAAVKVPRSGAPGRPYRPGTARELHEENQAIRTWAMAMNLDVAPRGRIAQEIVDKYHAAGGKVPDEAVFQATVDTSEAVLPIVKAAKKPSSKPAPKASTGGARPRPAEREAVAARGRRRS